MVSIGVRSSGSVFVPIVLDGTEKVENPNKHVDARAFSLKSIIDSGGSLTPAPKLSRSNVEDRDRVDSFYENNINKFQTN